MSKNVVVTGANGYLGQHLVAALIKDGASVRAFVRPSISATEEALLSGLGATIIKGNLSDPSAVEQAFADAQYAVHLIGSVAPPKGGPDSEELHRFYSLLFANACLKAPVKKAVLVTALGASEKASSKYLTTKKMAEVAFLDCLKSAGVPAVVVRPSLIIGRTVGERDSKLVARYRTLLTDRPRVPLVGGGQNLLQPVFVSDLASAIGKILSTDTANIVEIGGPEKMSMRQFVDALGDSIKVSKPFIDLPAPVAGIAAIVLSKVQEVPLLSVDQVKLASEDMVTADNALPSLLSPAQPVSVKAALETYKMKTAVNG